ncbi:hypothetical protein GCM10023321_73180 [Pseudonocardia eucalypti]|uniref:Uncharacterized protein n=1 Tax=Pseudonocardia eucalypti TaxID=648755 RepID=A0ABP9R8S8_9PSEU
MLNSGPGAASAAPTPRCGTPASKYATLVQVTRSFSHFEPDSSAITNVKASSALTAHSRSELPVPVVARETHSHWLRSSSSAPRSASDGPRACPRRGVHLTGSTRCMTKAATAPVASPPKCPITEIPGTSRLSPTFNPILISEPRLIRPSWTSSVTATAPISA